MEETPMYWINLMASNEARQKEMAAVARQERLAQMAKSRPTWSAVLLLVVAGFFLLGGL